MGTQIKMKLSLSFSLSLFLSSPLYCLSSNFECEIPTDCFLVTTYCIFWFDLVSSILANSSIRKETIITQWKEMIPLVTCERLERRITAEYIDPRLVGWDFRPCQCHYHYYYSNSVLSSNITTIKEKLACMESFIIFISPPLSSLSLDLCF